MNQLSMSSLWSPALRKYAVDQKDTDYAEPELLLTERQKYSEDKAKIKAIFNRYEAFGLDISSRKLTEVQSLYSHAYGKIDTSEFIETERDYNQMMGGAQANISKLAVDRLDYYPIIPTIVNGIKGAYDKLNIGYTASAVNPEAVAEFERMASDKLRSQLLEDLEAIIMAATAGQTPDVVEAKRKSIEASREAQQAFTATYKNSLEEFAAHQMALENQMFDMANINLDVLEQLVVTGEPIVHIDFNGESYVPEVIPEHMAFYVNSPNSKDLSECEMFGFFEAATFSDVLSRYSKSMTEEQVASISRWADTTMVNAPIVAEGPYYDEGHRNQVATHNARWFHSLMNHDMMTTWKDVLTGVSNLLRVTTIYFYVPRKVGTLTVKNGSSTITEMVDSNFVVTEKPVYRQGKKKSKDTLVRGEHIDWWYMPELWRGKKVSKSSSLISAASGLADSSLIDDDGIWVELDRCSIQFYDPYRQGLIRLPVHGGPTSDKFGNKTSIVKMCAPFATQYNWLMNRGKQLLATEIGKFMLMADSFIPNSEDTLEGSFDGNNVAKFAAVARDTGIAPMANPVTAGGASALALQGGFGQVMDLTNTNDLLQKTNLLSFLKRECYAAIGLTPEGLLGDYSPEQSAASIQSGEQRTATQIQHLFTRLDQVLCRARETMIMCAQHLAARKPTVQMMYNTSDRGRVVFQTSTEQFPLHSIAVRPRSTAADMAAIQVIKNIAIQDNTMGSDALEKATLVSFKTLPELFTKLRELRAEREQQQQIQLEQAQQMEQQRIAAEMEMQERKLTAEAEEAALDREAQILKAQIIAVGYSQGTVAEVRDELLALQKANSDQQAAYARAQREAQAAAISKSQGEAKLSLESRKAALSEQVEMKKLEQKDRELNIREQDIKARNARTNAID